MQSALLFSDAQTNLIIIVAVVFAVLFVANSVLLVLFFYKRKKSSLCTQALRERRDRLLEELAQLRDMPFEEGIEEADVTDVDDADFDEEVSADGAPYGKILAVRDMSPLMREKLGFVGEQFDGKSYYVRYAYGFEAKLRSSNDSVKNYYTEIMSEAGIYCVKTTRSFRQERIYFGRKTVAVLLFRGKTLCLALALNPDAYQNTKYSGIDASDVKRFKNTPMLLKITSARRLTYAKYLLNRLAEEYKIAVRPQPLKTDCKLEESDDCGYFAEGLLKLAVTGEATENNNEETR